MINRELTVQLLAAPEGQMDEPVKDMIRAWSTPPTRDEITQTRNAAAYSGLCSDFVIGVFNIMIEQA